MPVATLELPITGMTCANCVATVERTLTKKVPGVVEATVNFATEKATVKYIPGAVSRADMVAAIERAGYGVVAPAEGADLVDAEKEARERDIRDQTRKLLVGRDLYPAAFSVQLWPADFGLVGHWATIPGSTGCSGCWRRRCSFIPAGIITWAASRACATGRPTWTCWWPWAPRWPTSTPWPSLLGWLGGHVLF